MMMVLDFSDIYCLFLHYEAPLTADNKYYRFISNISLIMNAAYVIYK